MTKIEELEKQVAEMKTTIEAMKAEEAKFKKFEFKYPKECYLVTSTKIRAVGEQGPVFLEHGRYRLTEDVANQSLARNKLANRLEAKAEQLGGLKEWKYGEANYCIYYDMNITWRSTYESNCFYQEVVYMTIECAEEICRMLNEGEFEL